MEAGAKGCEVIVTGKLRAARAKAMKFKDGYMISSGNPTKEFIDSAVRHVLLRQGCLGIKVSPPVCVPFTLHASRALGACCSTAQACRITLGDRFCSVYYIMLCGMLASIYHVVSMHSSLVPSKVTVLVPPGSRPHDLLHECV